MSRTRTKKQRWAMVLNCTCTIHTTRPTVVKNRPTTTVIRIRAIIIHIEMEVIRATEGIDCFELEKVSKSQQKQSREMIVRVEWRFVICGKKLIFFSLYRNTYTR